jgi:hypothetical protein
MSIVFTREMGKDPRSAAKDRRGSQWLVVVTTTGMPPFLPIASQQHSKGAASKELRTFWCPPYTASGIPVPQWPWTNCNIQSVEFRLWPGAADYEQGLKRDRY